MLQFLKKNLIPTKKRVIPTIRHVIPAKAGIQIVLTLATLLFTTQLVNAATKTTPTLPIAQTKTEMPQQKLNEAHRIVIQHRTFNAAQIKRLSTNNILLKNHLDLIEQELTQIMNTFKEQEAATKAHQHTAKIEHSKAMKQIKMAGWIIGGGVLFLLITLYSFSRSARTQSYVPHNPQQTAEDLEPQFFEPEPHTIEEAQDSQIGYTFTQHDVEDAEETEHAEQGESDYEIPPETPVEAEDTSHPEDEGEFDYLASAESLPAKLDLARAYIQMEDYATAREVLSDIIEHGDDKQRQDAKHLLNDIIDL